MTDLPPFSIVDILAILLIALGTLHGYLRGLSGELAQFLSVIAAFVFGLWFHHPLALWMLENTRLSERPSQTLAFLATVLAAMIVMLCLRFVVKRVMRVIVEERFDKIGGCISGFIRSSVIVIILFVVLNMWPHEYLNRKFGDESFIGSFIRAHIGPLNAEQEAR